ncbi:MAG: NmrA/HSCARG family protein [Ignavibacteria bacterium]|nr:NmrA/HSCARG family protein [Ignavibacteria bacterium]
MEKKDKTILVTGSTGQQGGAVARHLLKDGWKVRAFVRDEKKESAIELEKSGAELFKGDMNDSESLDKAMEGIYGVFSIQNFWEHGYDGELNHGKAVADAAKKANVQHFLQSSVGGAERNTKLPHFDVKFEIEKYLKSLNLPVTVIRPVFFMENFKTWFKPVEADGKLTLNMAMKADTKLQMIAVDEIGAISAKIFDNPDKFIGKEIELAGDELTMPEVAALYETNTGKKTEFVELPVSVIRTNSEEMADMFQWFIDKGYEADLKTQKDLFGKTISFKEWLQ